MAKQTKIAANLAQNYTPSEQAQARQNIGLATVAHTGDFNDLVNKPANITGQVQSNWTQDNVTAVDYIRNKPVIHTYTAGENVSISNDVISAVDTKYTAGNGLTLNGTEFSADTTVLQEKLTAGSNVQIADNVISATDTKYTAGTNISIDANNVISATSPTVNDGDLKFQIGGSTATKVFSANQSGESTIVVPYLSYTVNGSTTTYNPGVPTIEDMQAIYSQADWDATSGIAAILNKPTIPAAANDGILTITQGSTTLGTFSANQSGNSSIAIPTPPHIPVQYYHAANFVSWPITSNTSYSTYLYTYPAALDKTKDYIVTFSVNIAQPSNETWSLDNVDIPYHFNVDTTGSFSVMDTTGYMTNLGGRSLYSSSLSFTVKITPTYMSGENLNFLLYFPPNTLTTSNTVELSYKIYYQEYIA